MTVFLCCVAVRSLGDPDLKPPVQGGSSVPSFSLGYLVCLVNTRFTQTCQQLIDEFGVVFLESYFSEQTPHSPPLNRAMAPVSRNLSSQSQDDFWTRMPNKASRISGTASAPSGRNWALHCLVGDVLLPLTSYVGFCLQEFPCLE